MSKRMTRLVATTALAAGIVAVPAAGSAFASTRGSEQFYGHQVEASTRNVHYSESTTFYSSTDWSSGHWQGNGHHGYGLLGLGLIVL
ncbi:hypothetical protein GCM10020229_09620 [Kitasatospora albolonga]|uniref:hypothetical protein n=1 Tax=Kitasatospora albolonga TaxID=68173 RepID=UPI0031EA1775